MKKPPVLPGERISSLERAYEKVLAWFYAYPRDDISLSDLCKNVEISKTTANIIVSSLKKEDFLLVRPLGKVWRIQANIQHSYFTQKRIPFNLQMTYESGIIEWIHKNIPSARTIILFGSHRKGDDIESSDLDIAVEVLNPVKEIIPLTLRDFGYRKNVSVQVHVFSRKNIDLNLFANIANGIILEGFLEVRP